MGKRIERPCSIEGCQNLAQARGWCPKHYQRWRHNGDPAVVLKQWGEQPAYHGAHIKVRRARGAATAHNCVRCGGQAKHWAYDHRDPAELESAKGPYSLDPAHYQPMCVSCHKVFDLA